MKTLFELSTEAEKYFSQMKQDEDATQKAYQHIFRTIDKALPARDHTALLALIPYIEKGEGYLAFQYIGKTHRILRLLHIIELEYKFRKPLFSDDCNSAEELLEKYMLTLFSLRRLLFHLSDASVNEAVYYLQEHPISYLAAYVMTHDELLIPNQMLYEDIAALYSEEWPEEDMRQFFSLIDPM